MTVSVPMYVCVCVCRVCVCVCVHVCVYVCVCVCSCVSTGGVYGSIEDFTVDCTGREDGVAEIACDGYIMCEQGEVHMVVCPSDLYYDRDAHKCLE